MHKAFAFAFVLLVPVFGAAMVELGRADDRINKNERASATSHKPVEPFSMMEIVAPEGKSWDEWRKAKADLMALLPKLAQCEAKPDRCSPPYRKYVAIIDEAKKEFGMTRIEIVHKRINTSIRYTPDWGQWGVADKWTLPFASDGKGSIETGMGDCEDYALAKVVALLRVGVAAGDMRLVLVHDNAIREDHAVLAVREIERWWILDNRWEALREDRELVQFKPLVVLHSSGVALLAKSFTFRDIAAAAGPKPDPSTVDRAPCAKK
jgi:predicted transglutaminase-like cysteine proteinase